jgi:putative aldouronate transport system substrate-binding protein
MKIKSFLMLTMLTTAIVCAVAFTACGKKTQAVSSGASRAADFPGGWKPTADYSKKLDLEFSIPDGIEGYDLNNGDDLAKWYAEHFNYNMSSVVVTFDNWAEKVRLWVSAGEMPALTVIDYNHTDMSAWVEQELLYKFPDEWKTRWPNAAATFELTGLGPVTEEVFGGTYFLPRVRYIHNLPGDPEMSRKRGVIPSNSAFLYNKTWMEAVGMPVKNMYTVAEIIEYGRRVKEQDPGKIGDKLLPLTSRPGWAISLFVGSNNAHYNTFYKSKDGSYKWGPADEATLAGLKQWFTAWDEGVLNREFYTLKAGDDDTQFWTAGIAGGCFENATVNWIWKAKKYWADANLPGEIGWATVLGQDSQYHQESLINFWSVYAFPPDISKEKFERFMDIFDFTATSEGSSQLCFGFEGIDWKRDENGNMVSLATSDSDTSDSKYRCWWMLPSLILPDDLSFSNPSAPKDIIDLSWQMHADGLHNSTNDTLAPTDWDLYLYDSPARRRVSFMYDQEYANIVTNSKSLADVEKNWRAWLNEKMTVVQPVLDELNAKFR